MRRKLNGNGGRDKRVGTSKNLRQETGDEFKVGLQPVPSDSNDKSMAAMLDDASKYHPIWRR